MTTRRRLIGVVWAVCALLVLPAGANASTEVVPARGPEVTLRLAGTHGYRIEFSIAQSSSEISVTKQDRGISEANYSRPAGAVGRDRVSVGFGPLGKVSARFVPTGPVVRLNDEAPICKGGPDVIRFGTFVGTIRFEGESGYTSFASRRVPGAIRFSPRRVCRFPDQTAHHRRRHRQPKAPLVTNFTARSDSGVTFLASQSDRDPTEAVYAAASFENRGAMTIFRSVFLLRAPASSFVFDSALNSATISPPPPFSGSASFQRIDDFASRWEGPLTLSFPGRPDVPLTGREYSWSLRQGREGSSGTYVSIAARAR